MTILLLLAVSVSVVAATTSCAAGQVYVAVTKKCTTMAEEESYQILRENTVVITSSPFAENEQRTDEYCLPSSAHTQYVLKLKDSARNSWMAGAWISVAGLYGNVVFKNYMTEDVEESFPLSLYYAISKQQQWKMFVTFGEIDATWNALAFDDSTWQTIAPATITAQQTGTQYYRKQFSGVEDMAAYEIQVNYRYGVIIHLNGKEVFRDQMPSASAGAVTPSTASVGGYTVYAFRGVIRPATEVFASSPNMLAVELHFRYPNEAYAVEFDAYVAAVASSISSAAAKCFIYPYALSITSSAGTDVEAIFDFDKASAYEAQPANLPAMVTLMLSGPRFFFNGLRVWPNAAPTSAPGSFVWYAMTLGNRYTPVLTISDALYGVSEHREFYSYFKAGSYSSYRFRFLAAASSSSSLQAFEMQPLICALEPVNVIAFAASSYTVYAKYQNVNIAPSINEFSGCSIQPALPTGLRLVALECTVTGKAMASLPPTVFTVTSRMTGALISGTFTLEVTECPHTLLSVTRSYQQSAYAESFSITDAATEEVLLSVAYNAGQPDEQVWSTLLCVAAPKVEVLLGSRGTFWQENSFLTVEALVSGDSSDTVARLRYDMLLGLPERHLLRVDWAVVPQTAWQYKMGSVYEGWQTDATAWDVAVMGSFPASSNQIQLYRKTFNVASLEDVAGFVISLRYLYGCVVYLNGVEVFRNGVEGVLSTESVSTNKYTSTLYRKISLPVRTLGVEYSPARTMGVEYSPARTMGVEYSHARTVSETAVNYLQEGANTIAIALVAQTASQKTSYFDCAVRLALAGSRVFDYSISYEQLTGRPEQIADQFYYNSMGQSTCGDNQWTIAFEDNRREWISSVTLYLYYTQGVQQPTQFALKARNTNLEDWTTLKNVTGMTWSLVGEHKRIWVENSQTWNQYRFENFGTGNDADCEWKIGAIDLGMEVLPSAVPELAYSPVITVFKNVEMGEVYPNSEYYFDFAVTPALPEGITVDPTTGKISGTARMEMAATDYTITAKKVGGGSSSATVTLSVEVCTDGKSLITLVVRTDSWPYEGSYKLHVGRGVSGEVIRSSNALAVPNGLNYADWCLPHALYTVELKDAKKDGWANPAGWWLTVDLGAMLFEMGQMPSNVDSVSTVFASLLPFQVEVDEWKLFNSESVVPEDWKAVEFDDREWQSVKAEAMGNHVGTTAYIRREVTIPSLEDYQVLNVRVKYTGGIAAYFNGRLVARFNLAEGFDRSTEAQAVHDASLFSKFHVILSTVGAVAGKNVMAFEVHRSADQSEIVFDATGVFGVNDCSVVVDTFSSIDASPVSGCTKEDLLDLNPSTFGSIPNLVGSFIEWTVENLEGSKWNGFALQTSGVRTHYGFSLYGRWEEAEEFTSALEVRGQETKDRARLALEAPVGLAGFKTLKFVVEHSASDTVSVNAYVLQYCRAAGSGSCPGVGDFPAVGEGQISPAKCAEGFQGYAYRECVNGVLGDVKNDKCEYKLPADLKYAASTLEFVLNAEGNSGAPSYKNIITEFFMQENTPLPEGLSIDAKTGEISGKPVREMDATAFTVRGKNPKGETFVEVMIVVRKGFCQPEGVFEKTPVGEVAVYECSQQGSYVGTQTRACVLGKKDGEWQKASGVCVSVVVIVVLVIVVVVIVAVVVLLAMKTHKKKAVGGVKGKVGKVWCVCWETGLRSARNVRRSESREEE